MANRRDFLKTCACAACFCGFGSLFQLSAQETNDKDTDNPEAINARKDEAFALQWITELLDSLGKQQLTENQMRTIIKQTSQAHHDLLNVPSMVMPYIGSPDEFIKFLKESWGWVVTDNKEERRLIVDENKPFCVCPLLKNSKGKLFPSLCYCSEGFAEKMFSAVYQKPVTVKVGASVQRGDASCVYIVDY